MISPSIVNQGQLLVRKLNSMTWSRPLQWGLFEGWRSPQRQAEVVRTGNSQAQPWESPHQYGLALDLVPKDASGWTWNVTASDKKAFRRAAEAEGLSAHIKWDPLHVEARHWPTVLAALRQ